MRKFMIMLSIFFLSLTNTFATTIQYEGNFQNCLDTSSIELKLDDLLVPGDSTSETIHFSNELSQKVHLDLIMEENQPTIYNFQILKDHIVIYEGKMDELKEGQKIRIGEFNHADACDLTSKISIPTSLNNDYTFQKDTAKWKLVIEEETYFPNTGLYRNEMYLITPIMIITGLFILGGKKKHG